MQCYNCNSIYNDYLRYCPYCGVKKAEFNVCSNCGKKLTKNILICPNCGGKPVEETNEMKSDRLNREGLETNNGDWIEYFNEAIRFNKYNIDAWVNKSRFLNSSYKANKCCDAGLKINKNNMKLLLAKAKSLKNDEKSNEAMNILNNLLKRCENEIQKNELNENLWILKGEVLHELDEEKESIKCYSKALEINPLNEKSWVRKAELCGYYGNETCKIESYKKAIELNPTNKKYYEKIGDNYHYLDDNEHAIEYYNNALELDPDNAYLWDKKGDLEREIGKYEDALKSYSDSIKIKPSSNTISAKAGLLCELNRFEEAIKCYNQILEIDSHSHFKNLKAKALIELEKYEEALDIFSDSIKSYPDYDETYLYKGNLLHNLGRFEEEVACYDLLLNKDDYNYNYYKQAQIFKGIALSKFDKEKSKDYFNELLDRCNEFLEAFPNSSDEWERKADILYHSGNLEEAFKCYDKTLKCGEAYNEGTILFSKARILYDLKDYEKAIECFNEALEISDFFPALQYKGYCLEELKQYDQAMICYNKCLEIKPNNKEILLKKSELNEKIK